MSSAAPGRWTRINAYAFVIGLLVSAAALTALAVTTSGDRRGAFLGLAVLWDTAALAATALLVALERKRRRG